MNKLNIMRLLVSLLFILILLMSYAGKDREEVDMKEQLLEIERELYFLGHDKAVQETMVEDINEAQ